MSAGAAEDDDLPPETRAAIGRVSEHTYDVTTKDIRRYAQALEDPNPLYWDEEYAAATPYGGIVAPPLFCHSLAFADVPASDLRPDGLPIEVDVPLPVARAVGGASSIELQAPIRPGDLVTVRHVVADIYRKAGRRSGVLWFVVLETTYTNQHGQVVARERGTFISR